MRETMKGPDHEGNQALLGVQLKDIEKTLPLRVLSEEDWEHWTTWGYVIVHDAIPPDHVERLKAFLWEFQEMNPNDISTWSATDRRAHGMAELNNSGMVEVYNHQLLWDTRQSPRVYDAYVDIWDREDLWVTIDRANLNTPNRDGRKFGGFIHWDVDTSQDPLPVNVQGVLSLVDTDAEVGGLQCVPELFRTFDEWVKTQPADRDPFQPGHDRVRSTVHPTARRGPDHLEFPAGARNPSEHVEGSGADGAVRLHVPGQRGQRGYHPAAHTFLARMRTAQGHRLPGRPARTGKESVRTRRVDRPRQATAGDGALEWGVRVAG